MTTAQLHEELGDPWGTRTWGSNLCATMGCAQEVERCFVHIDYQSLAADRPVGKGMPLEDDEPLIKKMLLKVHELLIVQIYCGHGRFEDPSRFTKWANHWISGSDDLHR